MDTVGKRPWRPSLLLAALIMATGCARTPAQQSLESVVPSPEERQASANPIIPGSESDFRLNVGDTVQFAHDSHQLDTSDRALVARQAAWLNRYPNVTLTIEGHADERGTREYNLALGARRANAVREVLVAEGVGSGRLETASFGKERPICAVSEESCWSKNRRGLSAIKGGANS